MAQTPTEQKAREVLAEELHTWAERHRKDDRSWPWIARKLERLSEGQISITPQYLRTLCKQQAANAAKRAA